MTLPRKHPMSSRPWRSSGHPRPPGARWVLAGLAALALAVSLGAGCLYPVKLSDQCKQQRSECLADCRDSPGRQGTTGAEFHVATDTRTACERHCDTVCP